MGVVVSGLSAIPYVPFPPHPRVFSVHVAPERAAVSGFDSKLTLRPISLRKEDVTTSVVSKISSIFWMCSCNSYCNYISTQWAVSGGAAQQGRLPHGHFPPQLLHSVPAIELNPLPIPACKSQQELPGNNA